MLAVGIDLLIVAGAGYLWSYLVAQVGGSQARVTAVTIAEVLLINFGYLIYGDPDPRADGRRVRPRAAGGPDDGGPSACARH